MWGFDNKILCTLIFKTMRTGNFVLRNNTIERVKLQSIINFVHEANVREMICTQNKVKDYDLLLLVPCILAMGREEIFVKLTVHFYYF